MNISESEQLKKAYDFAAVALAGKKRLSGEDVLDHCCKVAENLNRFQVNDPSTLTIAMLHHCLHEGAATPQDIEDAFGKDIAETMQAFESLRIIRLKSDMDDAFAENLRKMFLVLAKDLRVVLVKLADILDNLTTLEYCSDEKKVEVARKTLEIFAPLSERLGIGEMRGELQDLAFLQLDPDQYNLTKQYAESTLQKLSQAFPTYKEKLESAVAKEGIIASFQSRMKHIYSLHKKLLRPEIQNDLSKVPDLLAMRIIVTTEEECYRVLGIVNTLFVPLPNKVSDFIAHPKPNGYQSIHIKVYGPDNIPFEIQIRTKKMHEESEYGVAAHWNYSDQKATGLSDERISRGFAASAEKLEWVKKLSEWQQEIVDNKEFLKTVKTNLFGERIFCFTPKGDVKDMPQGATPVDFAYKVHSSLAEFANGAKVNGKMVSLSSLLQNGDVVEIVIGKEKKKPNRDWLGFVKTRAARKKIKKAYLVD